MSKLTLNDKVVDKYVFLKTLVGCIELRLSTNYEDELDEDRILHRYPDTEDGRIAAQLAEIRIKNAMLSCANEMLAEVTEMIKT